MAAPEVEAGVEAGLGVIRPTTAGRPRIRTNEARNDSPSSTNAGQNTPARPMISPARPAPTIPAMTRVAWATELAASRPSRGTTFGMTAPRAGAKNVPMLDWTNANRNSSQSLSALPTRTKPRTTIARSRSEASMIRRRSARSTYAPANNPIVSGGIARQIAIAAIAAVEPVIEFTSRSRARLVSPSPASETSWPSHSRR